MVGSREDCLGKEGVSEWTYLASPWPPNNQEATGEGNWNALGLPEGSLRSPLHTDSVEDH